MPAVTGEHADPALPDTAALMRAWLPYHYSASTREIRWCLPCGRATEPFFDDYVARCRREVAAPAARAPRSSVADVLAAAETVTVTRPAGFIFHVSRCGSTLLSGCCAELDGCSVLSESGLLTDVLLDQTLADDDKRRLLPLLMHWQARGTDERRQLIVKWNAWDLFFWPLLRGLYPDVPVVVLARDPVEILASHQRQCGRHMAGDPALAHVHPVLTGLRPGESLLDFRIRVLAQLFAAGSAAAAEPGAVAVDYSQLDCDKIAALCRFFGVTVTADGIARISRRMRVHSKDPHTAFGGDGQSKRDSFGMADRERIVAALGREHAHWIASCARDLARA